MPNIILEVVCVIVNLILLNPALAVTINILGTAKEAEERDAQGHQPLHEGTGFRLRKLDLRSLTLAA